MKFVHVVAAASLVSSGTLAACGGPTEPSVDHSIKVKVRNIGRQTADIAGGFNFARQSGRIRRGSEVPRSSICSVEEMGLESRKTGMEPAKLLLSCFPDFLSGRCFLHDKRSARSRVRHFGPHLPNGPTVERNPVQPPQVGSSPGTCREKGRHPPPHS